MKVIIAGSRNLYLSSDRIEGIVRRAEKEFGQPISELVCGMARGIDTAGYNWREERNRITKFYVGIKEFPYGDYVEEAIKLGNRKMAGRIRNGAMADYADALILIHQNTPGSLNMKKEAEKRGLSMFEVVLRNKNE